MMKYFRSLCVLLLIAAVGCHESEQQDPVYNDPALIRFFLDRNKYALTEEDVAVTLPLIHEILKAKQFKPLSDTAFDRKINTIFGETLAAGNCRVMHHPGFDILLYQEGEDQFRPSIYSGNVLISRTYKFIAPVYELGSLIDVVDSTHYTLSVKYNQDLISRNKYLLNDSEADLDTLLQQDSLFLKELVFRYGYTADQRINTVAMEEYANTTDDELMESVNNKIFSKNCQGNLIIKTGLLRWIGNHAMPDDHRLFDVMGNAASNLYADIHEDLYDHRFKTWFTLAQRREILAYISDVYLPVFDSLILQGTHDLPMVPDLVDVRSVYDPAIEEYYKKMNYFNLKNLQQEMDTPAH